VRRVIIAMMMMSARAFPISSTATITDHQYAFLLGGARDPTSMSHLPGGSFFDRALDGCDLNLGGMAFINED